MTGPDPGLRSADSLAAAQGDALTRLLLESPAGVVEAALENPALGEEQLLLLLRRPDLPAALLERLSGDPRWVSTYPVKAALVAHPHTPKVVALNLAKYLFWRDLARLLASVQVAPAVRRMAEVLLRDRVHEITLGERVALARMAPRELIAVLRTDGAERVIAALLENPRLIEDDLLWLASNARTPPGHLNLIARSERWGSRPALRLALARNPRTPRATVVAIVGLLGERERRGLAESAEVSPAVRALARSSLGA